MVNALAGQALLGVAILLVLHVAFSTYEHLTILKALDRPDDHIPFNIVVEAFVALFLGIFGAALKTPELKEISWASEMKTRAVDEFDSRLAFMGVRHRGAKLFGDAAMKQ
ncbi:magnesium transporter [Auriculariales sp. MPI-PUGE-AT-0066]|nr:magnesium transporter [Auriculariales sp. MPI-PUGE-AT-0066]